MTYHILPINDLEEHEESSTCKCNPEVKIEPESGEMLIVHISFDGREALEKLEKDLNEEP